MPLRSEFYRFELVRGGLILDQFNFVVPPQEMQYQGKYRGTVYKTFGGTHVDLQGMDNIKITLSGTTGGPRARRRWGRQLLAGDGLDALKYFRDRIWRYPENPRYVGNFEDLAVRFWDIELGESYWVFIDNFTFKKSKARPVGGWYDFTIAMTATDPPEEKQKLGKYFQALKKYRQAMQGALLGVQDTIDELRGYVDKGLEYVDATLGFVDVSIEFLTGILDQATDILTILEDTTLALLDRARQTVNLLSDTAEAVDRMVAAGETFGGFFEGEFGESVEKTFNDLKTACEQLRLDFEQALETNRRLEAPGEEAPFIYANEAQRAQDAENDVILEQSRESAAQATDDTEDSQAILVATYPKEDGTTTASDVAPGSTGDPPWTRANRVLLVIAGDGTTLTDLSIEYYGTIDGAEAIAAFNNLTTSDLEPGQVVRVPTYVDQASLEDNLVLDRSGDQYGQDIRLHHSSPATLVVASTGDLAVTSEAQTIMQALQNRVTASTGDLRSDNNYGFPRESTIGEPGITEARALFAARVREMVEADPRVDEAEILGVTISSDTFEMQTRVRLADGLESDTTLYVRSKD